MVPNSVAAGKCPNHAGAAAYAHTGSQPPIPVGMPRLLNLPGRQLPVRAGMAGTLCPQASTAPDSCTLIWRRVRARHAHGLMGAQRRRNYREIGLGPADKEMDIQDPFFCRTSRQ